eukprot:14634906-Ditylum_brightwellii.AAC.1
MVLNDTSQAGARTSAGASSAQPQQQERQDQDKNSTHQPTATMATTQKKAKCIETSFQGSRE